MEVNGSVMKGAVKVLQRLFYSWRRTHLRYAAPKNTKLSTGLPKPRLPRNFHRDLNNRRRLNSFCLNPDYNSFRNLKYSFYSNLI